MNHSEALALILQVITEYLDTSGTPSPVDPDTVLIGPGGILDSIGLVTVVLDVESGLRERGFPASLSADRALSARSSPFRTPSSFADFVLSETARDH
jgi:acyl carrier protein